ncbi:MAG: hypothetical protein HQM10_09395 [Candidatus Riflebacteria bacterium]|nr:hypothetical protein [Candidatus Riflebacteria bacterium]
MKKTQKKNTIKLVLLVGLFCLISSMELFSQTQCNSTSGFATFAQPLSASYPITPIESSPPLGVNTITSGVVPTFTSTGSDSSAFSSSFPAPSTSPQFLEKIVQGLKESLPVIIPDTGFDDAEYMRIDRNDDNCIIMELYKEALELKGNVSGGSITDLDAIEVLLKKMATISKERAALMTSGSDNFNTKWVRKFLKYIDAIFLAGRYNAVTTAHLPTGDLKHSNAGFKHPEIPFGASGFYEEYDDFDGMQSVHFFSYILMAYHIGDAALIAIFQHEYQAYYNGSGGCSSQDVFCGLLSYDIATKLSYWATSDGKSGMSPLDFANNFKDIVGTVNHFSSNWRLINAFYPAKPPRGTAKAPPPLQKVRYSYDENGIYTPDPCAPQDNCGQ